MSESERREYGRQLPRGLWFVVRFVTFDGDLLNGGIQQFFHNHTQREVCDACEVLDLIGATESAEMLQQAMSIYENRYGWLPSSKADSRKSAGVGSRSA